MCCKVCKFTIAATITGTVALVQFTATSRQLEIAIIHLVNVSDYYNAFIINQIIAHKFINLCELINRAIPALHGA